MCRKTNNTSHLQAKRLVLFWVQHNILNKCVAQHISSVSKACFLNIRDLRRIRNTIDQTTIEIDYCNSRLEITNISFYHSAHVLWSNLPSHLRQVVHHVTPSFISNSPVSNLLTSLFLNKLKTHLFHSSFPL